MNLTSWSGAFISHNKSLVDIQYLIIHIYEVLHISYLYRNKESYSTAQLYIISLTRQLRFDSPVTHGKYNQTVIFSDLQLPC